MPDTFTNICRTAGKAMKLYGMLEDGDRVMIGLSGGKDSLALVEVLAARQRIFKPRITVLACHVSVDNVPYQADIEYLSRFCSDRGVEFIHAHTSFDPDTKDGRGPCFLCSWSRRKVLFRKAEEFGCRKIALGHHKDDIVETLMLNQIFQGSYSTMPPVMKMDKFDMTIIRPLALVREAELKTLAGEHDYRRQVKNCPHETASNRTDIRRLIAEIEQLNPDAVSSVFNAMANIKTLYLATKKI